MIQEPGNLQKLTKRKLKSILNDDDCGGHHHCITRILHSRLLDLKKIQPPTLPGAVVFYKRLPIPFLDFFVLRYRKFPQY